MILLYFMVSKTNVTFLTNIIIAFKYNIILTTLKATRVGKHICK